jgi:hypothetical protein
MWHPGHPAAEQCEGCAFYTTQVSELSYLHSRDITYAAFCQGPYDESARYRDFMGWDMRWYSAHDSLDGLLTGRQVGAGVRDGGRAGGGPVVRESMRVSRILAEISAAHVLDWVAYH